MEKPESLAVGRIVAPWGVKGQVKVEPMTDFRGRLGPGRVIYVQEKPLSIEKSHWLGRQVIVKLSSVDTVEQAEKLRGELLEVKLDEIPALEPDRYYQFQIVGMEVCTEEGEPLGKVTEILETGSNDVYVVRGPRGEILVPAIEDVVKEVDLARGRITIEPIEGLFG